MDPKHLPFFPRTLTSIDWTVRGMHPGLHMMLEPLSSLPVLSSLKLFIEHTLPYDTSVDVSPLSSLTALTALHMNNVAPYRMDEIHRLSALVGLRELKVTSWGGNWSMMDPSVDPCMRGLAAFVPRLSALTNLELAETHLAGLKFLGDDGAVRRSLRSLRISGWMPLDLETDLRGLESLESLSLHSFHAQPLTPLTELTALTRLALSNPLGTLDVRPIAGMTWLRDLELDRGVRRAQAREVYARLGLPSPF